jgi:hypothetical protein
LAKIKNMFSLISSHKKLIIGIIVVVLLFVGYGMFKGGDSSKPATGDLTRTTTSRSASSADVSAPGKQFVSQLLAIQNIRFNTSLFQDPAFDYLQDFSRELIEQDVGRENPFAPIGIEGFSGFSGSEPSGFINTSGSGAPTLVPTAGTSTRATSTVPARR